MVRNIFIFLLVGFALAFIAIWIINGGIGRAQANIQSSPDPLSNLLGLSSSTDSTFALPGQAAVMPVVPSTDFGSGSDTSSSGASGSLSPADAQARLDALKQQYQDLRSQYETSGSGYTHPQ